MSKAYYKGVSMGYFCAMLSVAICLFVSSVLNDMVIFAYLIGVLGVASTFYFWLGMRAENEN